MRFTSRTVRGWWWTLLWCAGMTSSDAAPSMWALRYDTAQKKVLANYVLQDYNHAPIICFGTDESGEVYFTDTFGQIFQLARTDAK